MRAVLSLVLASAAAMTIPAAARADTDLQVVSLSNRADLVSGGDVLLEVRLPQDVAPEQVRVAVDGRDVTPAFELRRDGRFLGIVESLAIGDNTVTATHASDRAELVVTNHPVGGPIFSGPQIQPWYCVEGALDEQCNRPTTYDWYYMSSVTGAFNPYDPDSPPADLATTTTDEGKTVPYVVRIETGNLNRSQYRIAILTTPEEEWSRWNPPQAWNRKVWVVHGGGCSSGHDESDAPDVLNDFSLQHGYAVISHALENNTESCNLVVQAESVMMTKEHFIEDYGDIRFMIGTGGSGGAMAQLHMQNAYPGLYDGLTVGATFPDIPIQDLLDCVAIQRYFDDPSSWGLGIVWTELQMAAATGKFSTSVCRLWTLPGGPTGFAMAFDPRVGIGCDVPSREPEKVYHPQDNPGGVRCSLQDYLANVLGHRPPALWGPIEQSIGQGFANRPYDTVGVQYGLRALQAGGISPAQFVDLNAKIGAVDLDYGSQPERVAANPDGVAAAYRSGILNEANNLAETPIIDMPGFLPGDNVEIHDIYKSWSLRARLDNANGHHDNHVIWYGPDQRFLDYMGTMSDWLAAIEADDRDVPRAQKVAENKPGAARDICDHPTPDVCDAVFAPQGASTRWGAGEGIATDIITCQLRPLVESDYAPVVFTDEQWAQLEATFSTGVCDHTRPGVGQQGAVAWQTYEAGPGGRPLGPAPVSRVLPVTGPVDGPLPATGGGLALAGLVLLAGLARRARRAVPGTT